MAETAEAEHFHVLGEILELVPDLLSFVGVGSEANNITAELHVPDKDVTVQLRCAEPIRLVCFGVNLKPFPILYQVLQNLVQKPGKIPVKYAFFRIRGISDDIVEMTHHIKIPKALHLPQKCLKVTSISLFPVLAFVIWPEIRISVFKIVDRCGDLVERMGRHEILVKLPTVLV